jgi:hypothetical protein
MENADSLEAAFEPLREREIGDRQYSLHRRICSQCNEPHLEVWRWSGASFSRYHPTEGFDVEHFDQFVEEVDEMLLMEAPDLFGDFSRALVAKNSAGGIEADGSFAFRLLEYARHRAGALDKLGMLDAITQKSTPTNEPEKAVRLAFELGMAAAEHRFMDIYEGYVDAGISQEEWREAGHERARDERIRLGKKTRNAIVAAAKRLYADSPGLIRNDMETARQIQRLHLPELEKGQGHQVGHDAIARHLRGARKDGTL